ncbi:thioredoxin reductase (NADPH) [Arboricoccus pini]|uniref:Thioredoxin reductase n=1 Tax=Arboricoccus pini TaxID=1963835 RepID=A0A212R2I6_9PROT|nr:thioredoxin-disulfide reductase [Arboricoccus pini]SNB66219.1 thioredoxin reductase (NADPH) [Arboricoccus pini]
MSSLRRTRLVIIGGGPAGYTAAIYAGRANLSPLLIQGIQPGGQLTITTDVENYPGFADPVMGPWLMQQMEQQAAKCGAELLFDVVTSVDFETRPFRLEMDSGDIVESEAVIIATGAQARWLGLESEKLLQGYGVSACATCDGFFFKNKAVVVVGGGNTAVEEALYLAQMCEKVTLIHRRDNLRAERILQDRLFTHPKINVLWDHEVEEILADGEPRGVCGVRLRHVRTGELRQLSVEGVFVAIGHDPATQLFDGKLAMDTEKYIVTAPDSTATSVEGIFAAGDVQDRVFRQAVTAAGTGCMAALEAERYLLLRAQTREGASQPDRTPTLAESAS